MASVKKRSNGQWRARYRDAAGKEHARHFRRKVDADRWINEITADRLSGRHIDPHAGRVSLQQFADDYERRLVGGEARQRLTDNALRLHVLPELGGKRLDQLRRSDVQHLVRRLSDELAPGSVRNVHEVLSRVLESAVADRAIADNPAKRVTLPRMADNEVHPPATAAVHDLAYAIDPRYGVGVWLLAGAGLRVGELLGLRVEDVDFDAATLRVRRQRTQDGRVGEPKTGRSRRTIPLGDVVLGELRRHAESYPGDGAWVLTDDDGDGCPYWRWKKVFGTALERTGLKGKLTAHDLRHFYASALISGGASVRSVQVLLGHSSAAITLRVYSHLFPGEEDRTRSVIDDALRTECGL